MDAEYIANKARKAISKFCYEECHAYCCRKGYLILTHKEADLVTQRHTREMIASKMINELKDGKLSMYMGKTDSPCPSLKDYKCAIHTRKNRPLVCRQFPIFIEDKVVRLSHRCPAVGSGLFYPYITKWKSLGYTIIESDQFYELDRYDKLPLNA